MLHPLFLTHAKSLWVWWFSDVASFKEMTQKSGLVLTHGSTTSTQGLCNHYQRARESTGKQAGAFHWLRLEETHVFCAHSASNCKGLWKSGYLFVPRVTCLHTWVLIWLCRDTLWCCYLLSNSWIPPLKVCAFKLNMKLSSEVTMR